MDQLNSIANASATPSETSNTAAAGVTAFVSENNNAEDLLKLITGGNPSSAEEVLKMFKTKEKSAFYKRCPFCGLLFHAKEKMLEHFAERHAEQYAASPVDPDSLPEAEDVSDSLNLQMCTDVCLVINMLVCRFLTSHRRMISSRNSTASPLPAGHRWTSVCPRRKWTMSKAFL